jgi:hypothetical protein
MVSNMSWQVQDLSCYNSFEMEASQDTSLSVSLLIPLDEEHKTTGAFRLVIFGGDSESVPIHAEDVFTDLPEPLHGLYLNLRAQPRGSASQTTALPASGSTLNSS